MPVHSCQVSFPISQLIKAAMSNSTSIDRRKHSLNGIASFHSSSVCVLFSPILHLSFFIPPIVLLANSEETQVQLKQSPGMRKKIWNHSGRCEAVEAGRAEKTESVATRTTPAARLVAPASRGRIVRFVVCRWPPARRECANGEQLGNGNKKAQSFLPRAAL